MEYKAFQALKEKFAKANIEEKIALYVNTPDLQKDQYRELLQMYPKDKFNLLDQALW